MLTKDRKNLVLSSLSKAKVGFNNQTQQMVCSDKHLEVVEKGWQNTWHVIG